MLETGTRYAISAGLAEIWPRGKRPALFFFALIFATALLIQSKLFADVPAGNLPPEQEVGLVEHLGDYAPLDLTFKDENGDPVLLKDIVDKPTVVSLVYFNCPGICSPLLSGVVDVLDHLDMQPGKDYEVVTISFNPDDTPELATAKKANYFKAFRKKPFPVEHWKWLTGDSTTIKTFTDAVGFKYKRLEDGTYLHAGMLTILAGDGKITRYMRGIEYQPFDLKMALTEASQGRIGPTISKLLLYCFSYDPAGQKYVFNLTKVVGTGFLVFLVIFFAYLTLMGRIPVNKKR